MRERDWRLINHTRGVTKIIESKVIIEVDELREEDKRIMEMAEKERETVGFWVKAVIKRRK